MTLRITFIVCSLFMLGLRLSGEELSPVHAKVLRNLKMEESFKGFIYFSSDDALKVILPPDAIAEGRVMAGISIEFDEQDSMVSIKPEYRPYESKMELFKWALESASDRSISVDCLWEIANAQMPQIDDAQLLSFVVRQLGALGSEEDLQKMMISKSGLFSTEVGKYLQASEAVDRVKLMKLLDNGKLSMRDLMQVF